MTTSKSPVAVATVALRAAVGAVPLYRHRFSPKRYAQPQLIACLVLKEFFRTDYRGISAILSDSVELRHALRLSSVPHYTTLQKASRELLKRKQGLRGIEWAIFVWIMRESCAFPRLVAFRTGLEIAMILHGQNQETKPAAGGCVLLPRFSAATDSARRFR